MFLDLFLIDESRKKYLDTLNLIELDITTSGEPQVEIDKSLDRIGLSKLKVLKLRIVTAEFVNKLLSRCDHLTKLELNAVSLDDNIIVSIPIVKSFLERNQNLEDLKLGSPFNSIFFMEDVSDFVSFKLKRLGIQEFITRSSENIKRNFFKFLKQQSQSLEKLHIDACDSNAIEHAFDKMPAVTSLNVRTSLECRSMLGIAQLNLNERILELTIKNGCILETFTNIIRVVPNVTKLTLGKLTKAILEIDTWNLHELRTFQFIYSDYEVDDVLMAQLWWSFGFNIESHPCIH